MDSHTLTADSSKQEYNEVMKAIGDMAAAGGVEVSLKAVSLRTAKQNRMLWASLSDIAKQVEWYGQRMDREDWKNFFTAGLEGQRAVPAMDGRGFVVIGQSTKRMSRRKFADLVTLIHAFGNERQVNWSDPNWQSFVKEMQERAG